MNPNAYLNVDSPINGTTSVDAFLVARGDAGVFNGGPAVVPLALVYIHRPAAVEEIGTIVRSDDQPVLLLL